MTINLELAAYPGAADGDLLNRIDRRVASYYLAVPLAGEGGHVTVATAYPDNAAAMRVFERLLRAKVVPVSSSEPELHAAIARLYPEVAPGEGAIAAWSGDPSLAESVIDTANAFGRPAGRPIVILDASTGLDQVLGRVTHDFSLLVCAVSNEREREELIRRSPVSLVLVRGNYVTFDRLLVALRGFGSDYEALERISPILCREGAGATMLPLSHPPASRPQGLMAASSPARLHLQSFLRDLDRQKAQVEVRLIEGDPATQIVDELARGWYGLLVIAAEADGAFVGEVISRIEREGAWPARPILIVKPPVSLPSGWAGPAKS